MALLEATHLWHHYSPGEWALKDISFELEAGELIGLLGPSGCGKTTLLRLIAGFERPVQGSIYLGGQLISSPQRCLPPERRGVGMVFQDYALFPHLDAWQNASFGCRTAADQSRAEWLLVQLGISELKRRYPHELSGGQRQRLALVRALAPGPQLLLLDEPFSNLDVEVRLRLRSELRQVLAECGVSAVMVTHDPQEALAVCDRVAVMKDGGWHQYSSPRQLVAEPATAFVARFVLQGNVLPLSCIQALADGGAAFGVAGAPATPDCDVLLRQDSLAVQLDANGSAKLMGREFLGDEWLYQFELQGELLRLKVPLEQELELGSFCRISLQPGAKALLFPPAVAAPALGRS